MGRQRKNYFAIQYVLLITFKAIALKDKTKYSLQLNQVLCLNCSFNFCLFLGLPIHSIRLVMLYFTCYKLTNSQISSHFLPRFKSSSIPSYSTKSSQLTFSFLNPMKLKDNNQDMEEHHFINQIVHSLSYQFYSIWRKMRMKSFKLLQRPPKA